MGSVIEAWEQRRKQLAHVRHLTSRFTLSHEHSAEQVDENNLKQVAALLVLVLILSTGETVELNPRRENIKT